MNVRLHRPRLETSEPLSDKQFWLSFREGLLAQIVAIEKGHLPDLAMPVWRALEIAKDRRSEPERRRP